MTQNKIAVFWAPIIQNDPSGPNGTWKTQSFPFLQNIWDRHLVLRKTSLLPILVETHFASNSH